MERKYERTNQELVMLKLSGGISSYPIKDKGFDTKQIQPAEIVESKGTYKILGFTRSGKVREK